MKIIAAFILAFFLCAWTHGSGGYVASAVSFDGSNSWVSTNSLIANDTANGAFSFSLWFRVLSTPAANPVYFVSGPSNGEPTVLEHAAGIPGQIRTLSFVLGISPYAAANETVGTVPTLDVWHHIIGTFLGNPGASANALVKLYLDGTDITSTFLPLDFHGSPHFFTVPVNGIPFYVGSDTFGNNMLGDMADVWIAPGVSLLDGGFDIPLATRRKFVTAGNKPVYLGSNGSIPTGSAPAIFLSGNKDQFVVNQGTGGAFALTGSLTNAATSPSN